LSIYHDELYLPTFAIRERSTGVTELSATVLNEEVSGFTIAVCCVLLFKALIVKLAYKSFEARSGTRYTSALRAEPVHCGLRSSQS
jgi:hypothetical protein